MQRYVNEWAVRHGLSPHYNSNVDYTDNDLLLEYLHDDESGFTHLLEGCIVTVAV